jgi:hypothetical protein
VSLNNESRSLCLAGSGSFTNGNTFSRLPVGEDEEVEYEEEEEEEEEEKQTVPTLWKRGKFMIL